VLRARHPGGYRVLTIAAIEDDCRRLHRLLTRFLFNTLEYPNGAETMAATHVVFWLRVFTPWQGTVYVDNIRFE
jgi:hypothetical protein